MRLSFNQGHEVDAETDEHNAGVEHLKDVWGIVRAPGTLRRMRSTGGGPEYLKVASGEVIYTDEKLDAWAEANITAHSSTASYPPHSAWRRPRRPTSRMTGSTLENRNYRNQRDEKAPKRNGALSVTTRNLGGGFQQSTSK